MFVMWQGMFQMMFSESGAFQLGLQPHSILEEAGEDDDVTPEGTMKVVTCDKETNTELECRQQRRRSEETVRGSAIRRSQTFSPAGRPGSDYVCKVRPHADHKEMVNGRCKQ